MLHSAPTSEARTETTQSKSQFAPEPKQELHTHAFGIPSAYSFPGAASVALVYSLEALPRHSLTGMQSAYGNQAVLRMLQSPQQVPHMPTFRPSQSLMLQRKSACGGSSEAAGECAECKAKREGEEAAPALVRTKLNVSEPGDIYEQEADQVAERVMRMAVPRSSLARESSGGNESNLYEAGSRTATQATMEVPSIVHQVLSSNGGHPLDGPMRSFMEPRLGHDFSKVRVHTDKQAAESALSVNALAYTVGHQIVFGAEQYTPETTEGKKLLAHELMHVIQQESTSVGIARQSPQEESGPSPEDKISSYQPEENIPRGGLEIVKDEPNHRIYLVFGFDVGSSDVLKPGIREGLTFMVEEMAAVSDVRLEITGLASESRLKGKGAYAYGLERADAVKRYLAGNKAIRSITTMSQGSTFAPPISAPSLAKAHARAVTIDIRYTGTWPGIVLEPFKGPLNLTQRQREVEEMLTQQAREHGDLPIFRESSSTGYTYRYDHIIGLERHLGLSSDHEAAMMALQFNPNDFFPFNVEGYGGEKDINLGSEYDLVNKPGKFFPLPPGRHPIKVTEVTPTAFTFTTLEGHFDTPGSTITFTIYEDTNGNIHLEHYGKAIPSKEPSSIYLLAPYIAKITWDEQADNLSKWLEAYTETALQHKLPEKIGH